MLTVDRRRERKPWSLFVELSKANLIVSSCSVLIAPEEVKFLQ